MTDQDAEDNRVSAPLNFSKNTREKLRRNPRRSCRTLATAVGVSKSTMHQVLRDNLVVKPFKMLHRQEFTANHAAMKVQKCREILQEMAKSHVYGREEIRHPAGGKSVK